MSDLRRIAILGAGPAGLEAALLARTLGFITRVYEADAVASNVADWGHVRLFTPWALNVSALAERRLLQEGLAPAGFAERPEIPTGNALRKDYLEPLSRLPELAGVIRERTRVTAVARSGFLKGDPAKARQGAPFRLLLDRDGEESVAFADVVLDATGVYGQPNPIGRDGIPAPGETALATRIRTGLPNIAAERDTFAGTHVLVVGSGHSAATTVLALSEIPGASVTWVTRRTGTPLAEHCGDSLPERARLNAAANRLAAEGPSVTHLGGYAVERLASRDPGFRVVLASANDRRELDVDHIVNQTGFRPDRNLTREVQVHECYETEGPIKLAAALSGVDGGDCMTQVGFGPDSLKNPEPDLFILGHKSYGRNTDYLMRIGREQARDIFRLLTGNPALDPDRLETLHAR